MDGNSGSGFGRHLVEDQFEDLLRGELAPSERQVLEAHLSTCPDCQDALEDYRAIADVMANLPQVAVPRSFQLTPEMARVDGSIWNRLATFLFPMLPAMRAATLALVLMFGAVTAARIVDDSPDSSNSVDFAADLVPTETSVQQPAPVNAEPESEGAVATETTDPAARKDPEEVDNIMLGEADEVATEASNSTDEGDLADDGGDPAGSAPVDETDSVEESSQTGPANDEIDPAGTGPVDDTGDAAASGPADEAEMESMEMEAPAGDAPAETAESTDAFESAPADEDTSNAAGSTEMQLPGVASPEATATATASATPSPSATATATATPSPSATVTIAPTATATTTPTPDSGNDIADAGDWPLGRIQVLLGALVLLLGSAIVAVSRIGRRP